MTHPDLMEEARDIEERYFLNQTSNLAELIASALAAAEQRGREEAAKDKPKMEWKARGPVFNSWWLDFMALTEALNEAQQHPWWIHDTDLKYMNIRIDTRDNGFILTDGDGTQIEPTRVLKAIAAFYERYPSKAPAAIRRGQP